MLANFEALVRQRETLEHINPRLKSFFRGKKTTVEAGIGALLSLISHSHSGKTMSQADLFDYICERMGAVKQIFFISKNVRQIG